MTDKRVYSDEEILEGKLVRAKAIIRDLEKRAIAWENEAHAYVKKRDAVLKDLKALEAEVKYGLLNSFDIKHFEEKCDLTRSEKYAQSGGEK